MNILYYLAAIGEPDFETKYNILYNNLTYIYNDIKQNFDIVINCYSTDINISKFVNKSAFPYLNNIYIHVQKGILSELWINNPYHHLLPNYDYILFILDDVEIVNMNIFKMIELKNKHNIEFISPRVENSFWDYMHLESNDILRITNRIEVFCLLFDYNNFQTFINLNSLDNPNTWGIDFMMGHYKIKTAIYYQFNVNHKLASKCNKIKAREDMTKYFNNHGYYDITEVLEKFPSIIETIYFLPDDFSPEIYLQINADILNDDYYKNHLAEHYIDYGAKENRIYKYSQMQNNYCLGLYLNWIEYKNLNKQICKPFKNCSLEINIFLLCYNESVLLPHTIAHYKKYLPSCKITIYDNESTDNSVEIAKSFGCNVISWSSNNIIDDFKYKYIKNNCWKDVKHGWVIVADMDEFLCVTEDNLKKEMELRTTVLTVNGIDMVGESENIDLHDIDLQNITKYIDNRLESKKLCFFRDFIDEMNYDYGAHNCDPVGVVKYSNKQYYNKHMCNLGLNFIINKSINRYKRSEEMRKHDLANHYTDDIQRIKNEYNYKLQNSKLCLTLI